MAREFTDAQLQQIAEYVARRYLEVERGLRPREHLRRFLSPQAYDRQYAQAASRFGKGGVVRQTDLGPVVFQRPAPNHAHVIMPARQQTDRWGALVMELRADQRGVWRVTELTRAQDRNLARPQQPEPAPVEDRDTALGRLATDAQAAAVAHRVAAARHAQAQRTLARLAPEKPARDLQPGDLVNVDAAQSHQWVQVQSVALGRADVTMRTADATVLRIPAERPVAVLNVAESDLEATRTAAQQAAQELTSTARQVAHWDRELGHLDQQREGLQRTPPPHDEGLAGSQSLAGPPAYLTGMLGSPPHDAEARRLWDAAAGAIEAYRQRWGITVPASALGPKPADEKQRADRDETVALLRELTARHHSLDQHQTDVGSRVRAARSADRDPFPMRPATRT